MFLFGLPVLLVLTSSTSLPFSWSTVPTFAFPCFSDHILNTSDYNQNNLNDFNQVIFCAVNASCYNTTSGEYYAAYVTPWEYTCNKTNTYEYYPNMETSLQAQGKSFKEYLNNDYNISQSVVFAYTIGINAQDSYITQNNFNHNSNNSNYWLQLRNKGVINCRIDGCNWQGPALHDFDFRQNEVIDFFVNSVVGTVVNDNNLDGVFVDTVASWIESLCMEWIWNCTTDEYNDLFDGSLKMVDSVLNYLESINKYGSISHHTTKYFRSDYYYEITNLMTKYPKTAIRYVEFFESTAETSLYNNMIILLEERLQGISHQIHAGVKTLNPDWVELGAFLILAHNQSYFSSSDGWAYYSNWYSSEFSNRLGEPLNEPYCYINESWVIVNSTTIVYSSSAFGPMIAGMNNIYSDLFYIGKFGSFNECFNAIKSNSSFESWTYFVSNISGFRNMCYGQSGNHGWMGVSQQGVISGHYGELHCQRQFKYCNVKVEAVAYKAWIDWS